MKERAMIRKMSVTNGKTQTTVQVCIDKSTLENIASAKASYQSILGRSVSTSVIMRRGADLLARYLQQVHGEEWEKDELATLVKSIR